MALWGVSSESFWLWSVWSNVCDRLTRSAARLDLQGSLKRSLGAESGHACAALTQATP